MVICSLSPLSLSLAPQLGKILPLCSFQKVVSPPHMVTTQTQAALPFHPFVVLLPIHKP